MYCGNRREKTVVPVGGAREHRKPVESPRGRLGEVANHSEAELRKPRRMEKTPMPVSKIICAAAHAKTDCESICCDAVMTSIGRPTECHLAPVQCVSWEG